MADDALFDLPDVPVDFCDEAARPATFREQLAHAQMLLSWRKIQGLGTSHPPRNEERFVIIQEETASAPTQANQSSNANCSPGTLSQTSESPAE